MLLFVWFMSVWIFYFFYFQISAIFHINVPGLRRRRPEEYDMHNRKRPRIDYTPEFPQRPGQYPQHIDLSISSVSLFSGLLSEIKPQ